MASHERRQAIALDDAYFYCRQLETKAVSPDLFTICNAIQTLDYALTAHENSPLPITITSEAWSRVRDSLYNILVSSFQGSFFVYDEQHVLVELGQPWPMRGWLEFFPHGISRKDESYTASFDRVAASTINPVRWAFAEGRQEVTPKEFGATPMPNSDSEPDHEEFVRVLLEKLNDVCETEACEGKKKAHRKWWQLYWEASSCPNKRRKHELRKQMVALQSIWGTPAQP